MSEPDTIRIERHIGGVGRDVTIKEDCLFSTPRNGCQLDDRIECRYGLTDIYVPHACPLKIGETVLRVTVVRGKRDDGDDAPACQ